MFFIKLGSIFGLLSVVIGSLGAHSLENIIHNKIDIFNTGLHYQMFHSLALIITGIISKITRKNLTKIGFFFITGIILFSGSLYFIAVFKISHIGIITPIGGLFLMMGWILLIYKISFVK